ncbi:MAG: hypothetical protein LH614_13390 [Pyrinomonadaceae bacterium]|nr:hypothetical protein [Pyrinomonadaceae bacterium]
MVLRTTVILTQVLEIDDIFDAGSSVIGCLLPEAQNLPPALSATARKQTFDSIQTRI